MNKLHPDNNIPTTLIFLHEFRHMHATLPTSKCIMHHGVSCKIAKGPGHDDRTHQHIQNVLHSAAVLSRLLSSITKVILLILSFFSAENWKDDLATLKKLDHKVQLSISPHIKSTLPSCRYKPISSPFFLFHFTHDLLAKGDLVIPWQAQPSIN